MHALCKLDEIEDGNARAFDHPLKEDRSIIITRLGDKCWGFLNMCPHMGIELQFQNDKFMSFDGSQLQCSMHGALFDITSGYCTWGPCSGQSLVGIPLVLEKGTIFLPENSVP